jgi:general stress protein 26
MSRVKNLINENAIIKMREIARKAGIGFMQTLPGNFPCKGRPMALMHIDEEARLWFFSQASSTKNAEIKRDNQVQVIFSNPASSEFLCVCGEAEIIYDRNKNDELWMPFLKTWFPEGKDDPEISLICVRPVQAHYWDTLHNKAVALIKRKVGALVGMAIDDTVEGALRV